MVYESLGLMSGSSLDGIDIAHCRMHWDGQKITDWQLLAAETLPYSQVWHDRLKGLPEQNALNFAKTNTYFGYYMGELVNQFKKEKGITNIDYIASHGHTIFHDPERRYTVQIGHGGALAAITRNKVISDFRVQDVALFGEGAPLAPLADAYLFDGYDFYLNIGGIANLSANRKGRRIGFDFAPANQVLNFLAGELGLPYDTEGQIARGGTISTALLAQLQAAGYYKKAYPKSMANEWIRAAVIPIFIENELPIADQLATATELIALELTAAIRQIRQTEAWPIENARLLASGGGVFNAYLMERMQALLFSEKVDIILPEKPIIEFKESLLMSLLGLLRLEAVANCWPELTGAKRATVNGGIYLG